MDHSIYKLIEETVGVDRVSDLVSEHGQRIAETSCTNEAIGILLAEFPLDILSTFLSISDSELEREFHSKFARFADRHTLNDEIAHHIKECPKCSLRTKCDKELLSLFAPEISVSYSEEMSAGGHA